MKLLNILLILFVLALGFSCSSGKKASDDESLATASGEADFIVDSDEDMAFDEEGKENEEGEQKAEVPEEFADSGKESPELKMSGEYGQYTIKRNDTLMLIAFKLYGDYSKWNEIQSLNDGISTGSLEIGSNIKYQKPDEEFIWNPKGNPWVIRGGDTLGIISQEVYSTNSKWRDIYNNNRQLIKDPNLIFAGFTLYYLSDRELASE